VAVWGGWQYGGGGTGARFFDISIDRDWGVGLN
jgi:hypothetical protein